MLLFNVSGVVFDGPDTELLGLSDVKFVSVEGSWVIVAASEAEGALTTFGFDNIGVTGVLDTQSYSSTSGTRLVWDLTVIEMNGDTVVLPATRYENNTEFYKVNTSGQLGNGIDPSGLGQLSLNTAVTIGADTYVYTAGANGAGLVGYSVNSTLNFSQVTSVNDTGALYLGDISALTTATVGGVTYLFAASAYDTGIHSYTIGANGALTLADTVTPGDFSGFWRVQDMVSMEVGGVDYVVMASAGTSSLTVYSISTGGALYETDHVIDSLETRFQEASVLETFEFEGRSYVIAAGSDDGISVFELQSNGILREHASLADTYDTTLQNVTGISAEVIDGAVQILVSSGSDHGFTQITLDMTYLDTAISGTANNDQLVGSASADQILGLDGNDHLEGLDGDDILIDGAGTDHMTGGAGRDTFVFVEDSWTDVIMDFETGLDTIDLSQFSGVDDINDLNIYMSCFGVNIDIGGDIIIVMDQPDHVYTVAEIEGADFIF